MPLNKSTTYQQSVQFFVQFFSKKIVFLLIFLKKFYPVSPQIYSVLPHFTQFYLVWYSVLPNTRYTMPTRVNKGEGGKLSCVGSNPSYGVEK